MHASVTVDPYRTIGQIDPNIYGQFLSRRRGVADGALYAPYHPDAGPDGLRREVVNAITATGTPIIRWPGGCTGTSYDWRDGIGPRAARERTVDVHFGYDVDNGFGTAEFVAFCRGIGAEPHLNLSTGLGTLRDAVEWLEYANFTTPSRWANLRRAHGHEDPFNIRYWQIGNENYGPWEIGHQTPVEYATMAREWAKTLKRMDPTLRVLAVGGSQRSSTWDAVLLHEALPHIDYLTAHRYWNFDGAVPDDQYATIAATGYLEEQMAVSIGAQIEHAARYQETAHRPRLAYTEWNCRNTQQREMTREWLPSDSQYRLTDALAVASFLNMMQRQCQLITLASFAQSINVVGMLTVTDDHVVRETVYWPLLMQRHHSGGRAVECWIDCDGYTAPFRDRDIPGIPYLDVSASASDETGRLYLSVVNAHRHNEIVAAFQLRDAAVTGPAILRRLWHQDPNTRNSIEHPDAVQPTEERIAISGNAFEIALPPHSYSILELPLTG